MAVPTTERVIYRVEQETGGRIVSIRRQLRWRPTWFADVEVDGETRPMVVRCERVGTEQVLPIRHEYAFHSVVADCGLAVPRLYAWLDDLEAVLMERVPGRPDFAEATEAERDAVVDEYLQFLATLHHLDLQPFLSAGILQAEAPERSAMVGHLFALERYRQKKTRPEPFAEFCIGWFLRHPPESRGREGPVVWDSGQFHHENGRLVAVLDLEFAHIGDPMVDLAIWRMRDTLLHFGDMKKLYARYEELTGEPVDLEAIKRHHFKGTIGNLLMFGNAILEPRPETDLMNNMQWTSETNLMATEFLAEYLDIELPTIATPEPRSTRHDRTHDHLVQALRHVHTGDPELQHHLRLAFRTARHLQRIHEIGEVLEASDLEDLHQLLGRRPSTWQEADEELERFVLRDREVGAHDEALVRFFHRRNLRTHMLMGPVGSSMARHYTCQRFD